MDPMSAQETAERDQLWASLRALRPEIDRLAAGELDASERQRQLVVVLAREGERLAAEMLRAGRGSRVEALRAKAQRLEMEIALERAREGQ